LGDLKAFLSVVLAGKHAYWVVCSKVFLMMSGASHPEKGHNCLYSGVMFKSDLGDISRLVGWCGRGRLKILFSLMSIINLSVCRNS
jgi:hypothetical protein